MKVKSEKAITLIALVITIIVLLVLAAVSINTLFNDNGIIERAKGIQDKINEAEKGDLEEINSLNNWLEENGGIKNTETGGNTSGGDTPTPTVEWTQNKTKVTNGTTEYTVGDDYTYDCGVSSYTGGWGILGAENGKLLIMSTADIGTLELSGKEGYNTGVTQLDNMCKPYGTNARSIKIEDINRVTGYDSNNPVDGKKFNAGNWGEYGSKATYTASKTTNSNGLTYTGGLSNGKYEHVDGRTIGANGLTSITETSTYYQYYPNTLTTSNSGTIKGIETTSKAYELIFGTYANTSTSKGNKYWIASSCMEAVSSYSTFKLFSVFPDGYLNAIWVWASYGTANNHSWGVRAVVSL